MSASDGLKLLATHLAEVKLRAAESNYELNSRLRQLEADNDRLRDEVLTLELHAQENTLQWRLKERDDWKALVQAVQADRSRLEHENDQLKAEVLSYRRQLGIEKEETIDHNASEGGTNQGRDSSESKAQMMATPTRRRVSSPVIVRSGSDRGASSGAPVDGASFAELEAQLDDALQREADLRARLEIATSKLESWRVQKEADLEGQIEALRQKLDIELENKWKRRKDRKENTFWSVLTETVAPYPGSPPLRVRRRNMLEAGEEDEEREQEQEGYEDEESTK